MTLCYQINIIYHMISKARGNEKNVKMNNYGLFLAVFGSVRVTVYFVDYVTFMTLDYESNSKWYDKHENVYFWLLWFSEFSYLIFHWHFNFRYVASTFRMPILFEIAQIHAKWVKRLAD